MRYGAGWPPSLRHDPFKAIIAPRPIGWIGTLNGHGVPNLGPYSFFNAVGAKPNMVMFSSTGAKHSYSNAAATGEFTFSLAIESLSAAMNVSSASTPDGADEFAMAGLTPGRSEVISAPFVAESPAALECVVLSTQRLNDRHGNLTDHYIAIGEVVQTHIRDEFIREGRFDTVSARPIARMGYRDYATVSEAWELARPDD